MCAASSPQNPQYSPSPTKLQGRVKVSEESKTTTGAALHLAVMQPIYISWSMLCTAPAAYPATWVTTHSAVDNTSDADVFHPELPSEFQ